ncbi:MAG: DegT/DnrJ/EryC1/StrS family aminotransferase [Magnetococcales bacterium]|nr:DegT/DnrJ/EryC1/StrS family aminotransferase [Magnetococcales bacterium]
MINAQEITIPLVRPDLTQADQECFLAQLNGKPFLDGKAVAQWERAWQEIWQRPCVAFADATTLIKALKTVFGWSSGQPISCGPLLPPSWREALHEAWLDPIPQATLEDHGQEMWLDNAELSATGSAKEANPAVRMVQHHFGRPAQASANATTTLEEVSALLKPVDQTGWGTVQLINLDGNRMIQGGGSTLALSTDRSLIARLKKIRTTPPAAAICALGISQLRRLAAQLNRRQALARRYGEIRNRNFFISPPNIPSERSWEMYLLHFNDLKKRDGLLHFLNRAGIGAALPIWHHQSQPNPLDLSLALPLYASLSDIEQKRIINRIHRWVERGGPETPQTN